jgi:hypothetical protein
MIWHPEQQEQTIRATPELPTVAIDQFFQNNKLNSIQQ